MANQQDCAELNMEHRCTWILKKNGALDYIEHAEMDSIHHLYAIVVYDSENELGVVKYVGKTRMSLSNRYFGYRRPGNSQATNLKVHCLITLALQKNQYVKSFSFQDDTPLQWNGINMNIAAGLEDAVINHWSPEWNKLKNKEIPCKKQPNLIATSLISLEKLKPSNRFSWKLGQTYFNHGYMNPGMIVDNFFGDSGEKVQLTMNNGDVFESTIDRRANLNKTVRLKFNGIVKHLQKSYNLGDVLNIEIVSKNVLKQII
jgi:hypothetical protein